MNMGEYNSIELKKVECNDQVMWWVGTTCTDHLVDQCSSATSGVPS